MNGEQLTDTVYKFKVEGRRDKRKPCSRWRAGGKEACNARSLDLREAKVKCNGTEQWRGFVHGINGGECIRYD